MLSELWSDLRYRARALFRRAALEAELRDELAFHIEREARELERQGLSRVEALRRARIAFGGVERMKEASREARGTLWLETLLRDVRFATRALRKQPGFTATVVLILALGIGANTAVFTLAEALLLRPLPVAHPEQLVTIGDPSKVNSSWHGEPRPDYVSYPLYQDLRDRNTVLSGLYATGQADDFRVTSGVDTGQEGDHPRARYVSGNFFSVLEVPAWLGRTFTGAEDAAPGAAPVVVISYGYWQRRFAGARAAIGSRIRIEGVPVTVVGVTPAGFTGDIVGESTDLWLPLTLQPLIEPRHDRLRDRSVSWLNLMGRLAPGVSLARARAELTALEVNSLRANLSGAALSEFDEDLRSLPLRVEAGARGFSWERSVYARALALLIVAVALVALVICANVANLMLARAVGRAHEMTLRSALGAAGWRLGQQLLVESTLLALAGGALGLLAATGGSRLLLALARGDRPVVLDLALDARVLAFTAAVTLACIALFGLLPALRSARVDLASALRASGRSSAAAGTRPGRVPLRALLVTGQVALSLLLLMGSGLLVRSMTQLLRADLGMDRDHLLAVDVGTSRTDYAGARLLALRNDLTEQVQGLPGVLGASYSEEGIFSGGESNGHVAVAGYLPRSRSQIEVNYDRVGPDFLHTIGAHLLRGREIDAHDVAARARVAVVNATMARHFFGAADPIGRSVTMDDTSFTIVGVVADVQEQELRATPVRRLYLPATQPRARPTSFELDVRVAGDPARFVAPIDRALHAAHPEVPLKSAPLSQRLRQSMIEDVLVTQVTAFFGIVALVLAALGLYGVTAYATRQRTGEFGVRLALGAVPGRIVGLVLRETVTLALGGVAVGLPAGLLATRLIRGQLFGVSAFDPPSLGGALVVLLATALVAGYLPARRAARFQPVDALRTQ